MSPRFVLGRENVSCVAEVVNRSLKADCTDFKPSFDQTHHKMSLTSSRTVLYAMIATDNYDSSFCFWVFETRLTQENCFLFCKKYGYGLFNGFIF